MKTKISGGGVIDITAPSGGVTSGVGVLIGKLFGIAVTTAAVGETASIHTDGVFDHVAEGSGSGQNLIPGDIVYWDNTNKRLTKTSTSNTRVGVAVAAKATTDTTARFRIDPVIN